MFEKLLPYVLRLNVERPSDMRPADVVTDEDTYFNSAVYITVAIVLREKFEQLLKEMELDYSVDDGIFILRLCEVADFPGEQ